MVEWSQIPSLLDLVFLVLVERSLMPSVLILLMLELVILNKTIYMHLFLIDE